MNGRNLLAVVLAVLAVALFVLPAHANFIAGSCTCNFSDDPNLLKHGYTFDYANSKLALHEGSVNVAGTADPALCVDGLIDSDPTLWISEDSIINNSGSAWNGWMLQLDPAGTATFKVDATHVPSSNYFQAGNYTLSADKKTLQFNSPLDVPVNGELTLDFFVNVPYSGSGNQPFNFTLTQTPLPEPATMVLLAAGGLAMVLRRSRS